MFYEISLAVKNHYDFLKRQDFKLSIIKCTFVAEAGIWALYFKEHHSSEIQHSLSPQASPSSF